MTTTITHTCGHAGTFDLQGTVYEQTMVMSALTQDVCDRCLADMTADELLAHFRALTEKGLVRLR